MSHLFSVTQKNNQRVRNNTWWQSSQHVSRLHHLMVFSCITDSLGFSLLFQIWIHFFFFIMLFPLISNHVPYDALRDSYSYYSTVKSSIVLWTPGRPKHESKWMIMLFWKLIRFFFIWLVLIFVLTNHNASVEVDSFILGRCNMYVCIVIWKQLVWNEKTKNTKRRMER